MEKIVISLGRIGFWFVSSAFIWWGWNVLAPHLNAPIFNYWEIFAIRMMFAHIITIIAKCIAYNAE